MKKIMVFIILSTLILTSCNFNASLPAGDGDQVATSVAATLIAKSIEETVVAANNLSEVTVTQVPTAEPSVASTETQIPSATTIPTSTIVPSTNTPIPTATTNIPCNLAGFIGDVTVPDGTEFAGGTSFTKTWRLKNLGSCAWTTSYKLIFSHGDQMDGAGEVALPITVPPGQTIDLSINLKAPNAAGTYRGDYKLMDSGGNLFTFSNGATFYVEIKSTGGSGSLPPLSPVTLVVPIFPLLPTQFSASEIITANSNGVSAPGAFIVGDYNLNIGYNAFMKFDLSGIPDGSTITSARIEFPSFNTEGNPFTDLLCLRAYIGNYFPISTADVIFESTGAVGRACSMPELETFVLNAGLVNSNFASNDILQLKFQFNKKESDNDNAADRLTAVGASGAKLILEYTTP
jgi:hypothetical protein